MKKILLLTGALLALTVSLASAATTPGLDAGWFTPGNNASYCPVNPANVIDRSDPCNANDNGPYGYALALNAPSGITHWVGEEIILDVQSAAPILPDWWHLEKATSTTPAGCRDGSAGFSTLRGTGSTTTCKDYWGSTAQSGGIVWLPGTGGANRTRMFGAFARPTSEAIAITAGVEYYVGTGSFDTNHAVADVGVTFCAGCEIAACLVFQYCKVAQPANTPGGDVLVTDQNVRRWFTWQGGVVSPGGDGCPAATPTRNATWGQVKSMYR